MRRGSTSIRGRATAAGAVFAMLVGGASVGSAQGEPPPPNATSNAQPQSPVVPLPAPLAAAPAPVRRGHRKLVIAGLSTFAGGYGASIFFGLLALSVEEQPGYFVDVEYYQIVGRDLLIPIAGPWMAISDSDDDFRRNVGFAIMGVAQAAGLLMAIFGKWGGTSSPSRPNDSFHNATIWAAPTRGGVVGLLGAAF